jgi:predicted AlkP superfamily pyrophosphatase or phosphodiesterase
MVGVDGLRYDRIAAARTPVLDEIAATGIYATGALDRWSLARSESGPGWSTVATGVGPPRHGVRRNSFRGRRYAEFPDFLTRAGRLRPGLSTYVAVDWPPLVDTGLFGAEIGGRMVFDGETYGYAGEDRRIADASGPVLADQNPDVAFVYFGSVDDAGHRTGPLSAQYRERIETVDALIGELLGAVRGRATYDRESWLVVVCTDHGHRNRGGHGRKSAPERAIFAMVAGPGAPPGTVVGDYRQPDIAATVLHHLGIGADGDWRPEGRSLLAGPTP